MASEILERGLYNGRFKMVHNPTARGAAPRYKIVSSFEDAKPTILEKPKGVTTILGQTLAKDLMQWAADSACDFLREKLPVITEADLKEAAKAYTVKRDKGGSTGTEAHAMVENYLKKIAAPSGAASPEALNAYKAFVKWYEQVKPEVVNVEEVIYSKEYKFAGTYDCMLKLDGKTYLCDLKTTNSSRKAPNGVYAENFLQLGAYALAHEEQRAWEDANGEGPSKLAAVEGLMVISAKKDGKLDIVTEEDLGLTLNDCMEMFKRTVNLYSFMQFTTNQLGGK